MKQELGNNGGVAPVPRDTHDRGTDSIPDLVRSLATDLSSLLGKEIALAKAEARESASEVKTSIAAFATGGVIAMAGLVVLLMSAVYGLNNFMDLWFAALIVGVAALLIGYMMVRSAKGHISGDSVVPDRTVESVKKDKQTLKSAIQ